VCSNHTLPTNNKKEKMSNFKEYLHLERFGNTEVEGIELGVCYIFPKVDGTNASIWRDPNTGLECGSRTRQLSKESDNAGFWQWVHGDPEGNRDIEEFFVRYPNMRLYGEWLVPHTFKGYRQDAWRRFYIFDVYNDETEQYLSYDAYQPLLNEAGIQNYIPPLAIVKNGDYEQFLKYVANNFFLCPDGGDPGEGIAIKNYDFQNKYGRQCFAKIIRNEFKEMHHRAMGAPELNNSLMNEERIVNAVVSDHLVSKVQEKIILERGGFSSRDIPRLLDTVFYDVVREELWDQLKTKEVNFGTVNFKTLKALTIRRIKELKPEIFS
jgi:hypothetical protein